MPPEKIVVFGPIIVFFLFFGALVIGFLVIVGKLVYKGRKSAWKGEVADKVYNSRRGSFEDSRKIEHYYSLVFKTDTGQTIKSAVSKSMYDSFSVGDKVEKKSGTNWPQKI